MRLVRLVYAGSAIMLLCAVLAGCRSPKNGASDPRNARLGPLPPHIEWKPDDPDLHEVGRFVMHDSMPQNVEWRWPPKEFPGPRTSEPVRLRMRRVRCPFVMIGGPVVPEMPSGEISFWVVGYDDATCTRVVAYGWRHPLPPAPPGSQAELTSVATYKR